MAYRYKHVFIVTLTSSHHKQHMDVNAWQLKYMLITKTVLPTNPLGFLAGPGDLLSLGAEHTQDVPFSKIAQGWLKMGKDSPKIAKDSSGRLKMAPRWPKMAQDRSQDGSRWPKMAQDTPKMAQGLLKMGKDGPEMARDGSRRPKMAPRWLQDGSRWLPRCLKMAPKMAQDSPKMQDR